jgi:chorismate mutase
MKESGSQPSSSSCNDNYETSVSEELSSLRREIDKLDATVWSLLEKRFTLLTEVAKIKHDLNIPILDGKREKDILARIAALPGDPEVSSAISKLYELLFALSRTYQK